MINVDNICIENFRVMFVNVMFSSVCEFKSIKYLLLFTSE